MRTPVFELHILPMFRATDLEHMQAQRLNLSDYDEVRRHADRILDKLTIDMPPPLGSGGPGPWPDEWVQLFRRWMESGFKRLELGTAEYTFRQTPTRVTIEATGTFPAAGYDGWLEIESETATSKTYVLHFEPPDAPVAGAGQPFSRRESYRISSATQAVLVHDSTGVRQLNAPADPPG
jgi:hypothetical protein